MWDWTAWSQPLGDKVLDIYILLNIPRVFPVQEGFWTMGLVKREWVGEWRVWSWQVAESMGIGGVMSLKPTHALCSKILSGKYTNSIQVHMEGMFLNLQFYGLCNLCLREHEIL